MELEGKISVVIPALSGVSQSTGNQWMSQEYVMAYYWFPNQTNPSFIVLRAFGEDRIKQFNLQPNDEVKIRFHAEAHEYNGRWFNELRIEAVTFVGASANKNQQPANQPAQAAQTAAVNNQPANQPAEAQKAADGEKKDEDDDLPF